MARIKIFLVLSLVLLAGTLAAAAQARPSNPVIKGAEVGYFGSATVTRSVSVFVYSNLGPSAGNRMTVCVEGRCQNARGHNARTAWYSASFTTHALRMGDPVRFTVVSSNSAGRANITVTKPLLCMHNNGSTPQT